MALNPKQNLVIIKGKDHTEDILRVAQEAGRILVTYKNGKSYPYAPRNVKCLSNPERIPVENTRLFILGDMLSGVVEVLRFGGKFGGSLGTFSTIKLVNTTPC